MRQIYTFRLRLTFATVSEVHGTPSKKNRAKKKNTYLLTLFWNPTPFAAYQITTNLPDVTCYQILPVCRKSHLRHLEKEKKSVRNTINLKPTFTQNIISQRQVKLQNFIIAHFSRLFKHFPHAFTCNTSCVGFLTLGGLKLKKNFLKIFRKNSNSFIFYPGESWNAETAARGPNGISGR